MIYPKAQPSGEVLIYPDSKRVELLLNLPDPKSTEDVLRLLGLLANINKWIPSLSTVNELRQLSKRNVSFVRSPDLDNCMNEIRNSIKKHLPLSPFNLSSKPYIFSDASYRACVIYLSKVIGCTYLKVFRL